MKIRSLQHAVGIAVLLFALLPTVAHAQDFTYAGSIGGPGSGNGQFSDPYFITFDSSNNLYVDDPNNNRIQELTHSGTYIQSIGSGQLSEPLGVTLDSSGNIYVGDYGSERIMEFTNTGTFVKTVRSGVYLPYGLKFDPAGNLWAEFNHSYVDKFDSNGNPIQTVGNPGQIGDASGITFDKNGNLYVADYAYDEVAEYNSSGSLIRYIGSAGSGNGQINHAIDVVVDGSGDVFTTDWSNNRIVEFNSSGAFVQNIGVGLLSTPQGLAFDNSGNLFVANRGTNSILEFDLQSTPEPSALAAFGIGGLLLVLRSRKRKK